MCVMSVLCELVLVIGPDRSGPWGSGGGRPACRGRAGPAVGDP